jgi:hypothetical protein
VTEPPLRWRRDGHVDPGWVAVGGLVVYVAVVVRDWRVPDATGVPFWPLWVILALLGAVGLRLVHGRWDPLDALAAGAAAGAVLTDLTQLPTQFLRDLGIYLRAGEHFSAGSPVYLTEVLTAPPLDRTTYPFLYPPPTLPLAAVLAALPRGLVEIGWIVGSAAVAIVALRLLGLTWRWSALALLWPPFFQGLYVGNVAVPVFGLFVVAPWFGAGLVLAAAFKAYSGVAALWLLREGKARSLVVGVVMLLGLAVVTLPLVGLDAWRAWVEGLDRYAESQATVPELVGLGLAGTLPGILPFIAAAAAIAWAWLGRRLDGLARFGLATVVASPSLYSHGWLVALPAFLGLRPIALWLAIGITSVAPGPGWWLAVVLVVVASAVPALRRASGGPWPGAYGTV